MAKIEKTYPNFRIGDMVWEEDEESPTLSEYYIVKKIDKKSETYELWAVTWDHFDSRIFSFEYAHKWMKRTNNET